MFAVVIAFLSCTQSSDSLSGVSTIPGSNENVTSQQLDEDLKRAQIKALLAESDEPNVVDRLIDVAPFLTGIVAVVGIAVTIWRQVSEASRRRTSERRQQAITGLSAFEDRYSTAVQKLGSESTATRASAVVALESLISHRTKDLLVDLTIDASLDPDKQHREPARFEEVVDEILRLVIANTKVEHEKPIPDLLASTFTEVVKRRLEFVEHRSFGPKLDLSHSILYRVDLSGLQKLGEMDVAYADLRNANLTGSRLSRLAGYAVNLNGARLSRSELREARLQKAHCEDTQWHDSVMMSVDLQNAYFARANLTRAQLQSARFKGTDLSDTNFHQANLSDAHFRGAKGLAKSPRTLRSIINARNQSWKKANFDPQIKEQLKELDKNRMSQSDSVRDKGMIHDAK